MCKCRDQRAHLALSREGDTKEKEGSVAQAARASGLHGNA